MTLRLREQDLSYRSTAGSENVAPDEVTIAEKIRFLSDPTTYSMAGRRIEIVETHFSWVFLTSAHAFKLKKPAHGEGFDFRTVKARKRNAITEVRLNRRLAPKTYIGIVALTQEQSGTLKLGGDGVVVDWLVKMARLDADQMLDIHLVNGNWHYAGLEAVAQCLAIFFARAKRATLSPPVQIAQIKHEMHRALTALIRANEPGLRSTATTVGRDLNAFMLRRGNLLRQRVEQRRLVDGHGDLRPEHIYVDGAPQIIDCLEFRSDLRWLDPVNEIGFLSLECARLGVAPIEARLIRRYRERTGDNPPSALIAFYMALNALTRARLSVEHIAEPGTRTREQWLARAASYLAAARVHCRRFSADLDQRAR